MAALYYTYVVAFIMLLSLTNGAPQMRRHRRHPLEMYNQKHAHYNSEWVKPCGGDKNASTSNDTVSATEKSVDTQKTPYKVIRDSIKSWLDAVDEPVMKAIDTSDISQWSPQYDKTYEFLPHINVTDNSEISLRVRHIEMQTFVGAFQYLAEKQRKYDQWRNVGKAKSVEMDKLLESSIKMLCEIETAIKKSKKHLTVPKSLTPKQMSQRLTFRNNNRHSKNSADIDDINDIDDFDSKFAKARYNEYLRSLQQVFENRKGKSHRRREHVRLNGKTAESEAKRNANEENGGADNNVSTVALLQGIDKLRKPNRVHGGINGDGARKRHHHRGGDKRRLGARQRKQRKNNKHKVAGKGPNNIHGRHMAKTTSTTTLLPSMIQ